MAIFGHGPPSRLVVRGRWRDKDDMVIEIGEVASPIGNIVVAVRAGKLCALAFDESWPRKRTALERRFGDVEWRRTKDPGGVVRALRRYFDGDIDALSRINADPGGTPFQRAVWTKLRKVPAGRTVSYGELARAAGYPRAVRAVGAANGSNPVGLVIPCHRVIGSSGKLVGYGGGLHRKQWLLAHEGSRTSSRTGIANPA